MVIADNCSRIDADRNALADIVPNMTLIQVTPRGSGEMAVWRHVVRRFNANRVMCIHDSCRILRDPFSCVSTKVIGEDFFVPIFTFDVNRREKHGVSDIDRFDLVWTFNKSIRSQYDKRAYVPVQGAMAFSNQGALRELYNSGAFHLDTFSVIHRRTRQSYERALGVCIVSAGLLPGWSLARQFATDRETEAQTACALTIMNANKVSLCGRVERLPGYYDRSFKADSLSKELLSRNGTSIVKEWVGR